MAQKQREREEREEREALERERQRRRQGQELSAARQRLQEDEMRRAAEERRREKAEELAARSGCWGCRIRDEKVIKICFVKSDLLFSCLHSRQRVREKIERDKAERAKKVGDWEDRECRNRWAASKSCFLALEGRDGLIQCFS